MLDMFGGTGSVGIEALSQGAEHCIFLDMSAAAVKTIKHNLAATGLSDKAEVRHADAFGYLRRCSKTFDLIFIAPPQYKGLWSEAMRELSERPALLADDGLIVVQIDPSEDEALELVPFQRTDERRYGKTSLIFFSKSA
jgi:16S rRNA (guanine(966)-N(2))-methyltransferase RsmD